jgi:acetyl-CoA C-acetyltransferase
LWSTRPPEADFRFADVSDETRARTDVLDVAADHAGTARVDGYTVVHDRGGEPERAVVVATTPDGRRCVAESTDTSLATVMTSDEWVGREVRVDGSSFRAT